MEFPNIGDEKKQDTATNSERNIFWACIGALVAGSSEVVIQRTSPSELQGTALAAVITHNLKPLDSKSLASITDKWTTYSNALQGELRDAKAAIKRGKKLLRGQARRNRSQKVKFRNDRSQFGIELLKIESRYREDFAVKGPISYWNEKYAGHRRWSIALYTAFTLLVVVAIIFVHMTFPFEAMQVALEASKQGETVGNNVWQLSFVKLFTLAFPAFFLVWILRVILKSASNQSMLSQDAKEKATMIQTFRAFLESEDELSETDRVMIIQAIFRSSVNRTVEETPPHNWLEILEQIKR